MDRNGIHPGKAVCLAVAADRRGKQRGKNEIIGWLSYGRTRLLPRIEKLGIISTLFLDDLSEQRNPHLYPGDIVIRAEHHGHPDEIHQDGCNNRQHFHSTNLFETTGKQDKNEYYHIKDITVTELEETSVIVHP